MLQVHEGQCGLCTHFGQDHPQDQRLVQIRAKMEAAEDLIEICGHPQHERLHLQVTAVSRCDGFEAATVH